MSTKPLFIGLRTAANMPSEFARDMMEDIYDNTDDPLIVKYQQWSKANNFRAILALIDGLSDAEIVRLHFADLLEENEDWMHKIYTGCVD